MAESVKTLAALRRHIASLDLAPAVQAAPRVATGHAALDRMLGGGLARARVHEFFGEGEEEGAAAGLALLLAGLTAGEVRRELALTRRRIQQIEQQLGAAAPSGPIAFPAWITGMHIPAPEQPAR